MKYITAIIEAIKATHKAQHEEPAAVGILPLMPNYSAQYKPR